MDFGQITGIICGALAGMTACLPFVVVARSINGATERPLLLVLQAVGISLMVLGGFIMLSISVFKAHMTSALIALCVGFFATMIYFVVSSLQQHHK